MMLVCAAGDIHGAMDRLYQDVFEFEASLGMRFDYVSHVGDIGIGPIQTGSTRRLAITTARATFRHGKSSDAPSNALHQR